MWRIRIILINIILICLISILPLNTVAKEIVFPKDVSAKVREAHRLITFEGTKNFRDLGGYKTKDNRTVRWGALYRSDQLHYLTDRDLKHFNKLNLTTLIDFRHLWERHRSPDPFPVYPTFKIVEIPVPNIFSAIDRVYLEKVKMRNITDPEINAFMLYLYKRMVVECLPQYRQFAQEILIAKGKPVLFHCGSGGKDRTGFAAAIVLSILGVPENTVFYDYLLTNKYKLPDFRGEPSGFAMVVGVKEIWLKAAFDSIKAEYGSFRKYVFEGLQLTEKDIRRLRSYLLEASEP